MNGASQGDFNNSEENIEKIIPPSLNKNMLAYDDDQKQTLFRFLGIEIPCFFLFCSIF